MNTALPFDELARLLGDPSRAVMLGALMDGRQWTGRQLADAAHVTPSTASLHLKRLVESDIVSSLAHGRHKYYRISRPEVGRAIETLMTLAAPIVPRHTRKMDETLRTLRMCYDHLAGVVAVEIADRLVASGAIELDDESAALTDSGCELLTSHGISFDTANGRRAACKPCLDWSERRYHIGGRAGVAIARHALAMGWAVRGAATRALAITPAGEAAFSRSLRARTRVSLK